MARGSIESRLEIRKTHLKVEVGRCYGILYGGMDVDWQ